jgi:hypothetical protein
MMLVPVLAVAQSSVAIPCLRLRTIKDLSSLLALNEKKPHSADRKVEGGEISGRDGLRFARRSLAALESNPLLGFESIDLENKKAPLCERGFFVLNMAVREGFETTHYATNDPAAREFTDFR